jgi:L-ascorbate metabolism protein UlaG (beta-lactamase superfamily)
MKLASLLFSLLMLAPQVATEKTSKGDLKITPIAHGTLMFEFGGKVIHVDSAGAVDFTKYPKADFLFLTDIHGDHLDPKGIAAVKKGTTQIIAPAAVVKTVTEATVMNNGETKQFGDFSVQAIPMYNIVRGPAAGQLFHDKGRGNGYLFTFGDKRVFVAGDTECVAEIKALKNIDVAFLPMNLPYTMPPNEAAACAKEFKPKVLYAYHFGDSDLSIAENALKGSGIEFRKFPK